MPISLLEAMSYGNCCLVSDIPECSEVIEDKGIVFKKSNVESLKFKLEELCSTPSKVYELKEISQDFILSKYNWNNVVDQTLDLYIGN